MDWFNDTEQQILDADAIGADPDELRTQLVAQKTLNDDINSQKSKARDLISTGKRLRRESSSVDEDPVIWDKMDDLKQQGDTVAKLSGDRLSMLEQALPLAAHFHETHDDLVQCFDEMEQDIKAQEALAINPEQLKEQQDTIKVLKQTIADNKPLQDRLNKTGSALLKLMGEDGQNQVQEIMDEDNGRFDAVRNSVRERTNDIEEAIHQTSEVSQRRNLSYRSFLVSHPCRLSVNHTSTDFVAEIVCGLTVLRQIGGHAGDSNNHS